MRPTTTCRPMPLTPPLEHGRRSVQTQHGRTAREFRLGRPAVLSLGTRCRTQPPGKLARIPPSTPTVTLFTNLCTFSARKCTAKSRTPYLFTLRRWFPVCFHLCWTRCLPSRRRQIAWSIRRPAHASRLRVTVWSPRCGHELRGLLSVSSCVQRCHISQE